MANVADVDMSNAEELRDGYTAIPPGEYQIAMDSSERVTTKKGDGEYLKCVFIVIAGDYSNSKIFCNFNLWNPNPEAVRIAKSQWAAICYAAYGSPPETVRDSAQLHHRPFFAKISNEPREDKPDQRRNEIVFNKDSIRAMNAAAPVAAKPAMAPVAQQQAAPVTTAKPAVSTPPWKR